MALGTDAFVYATNEAVGFLSPLRRVDVLYRNETRRFPPNSIAILPNREIWVGCAYGLLRLKPNPGKDAPRTGSFPRREAGVPEETPSPAAYFSERYFRMSAFVLESCLRSPSPESSGMMRWARTLPSSTPHWSKESMSQIAPCTKTLCS